MSELLDRVSSEGMTWLSAGKFKGNVDDFFRGLLGGLVVRSEL